MVSSDTSSETFHLVDTSSEATLLVDVSISGDSESATARELTPETDDSEKMEEELDNRKERRLEPVICKKPPPAVDDLARWFSLDEESHLFTSRTVNGYHTIEFIYGNYDEEGYFRDDGWAASLKVFTSDAPHLMREGLFWSDANVVREYSEKGTGLVTKPPSVLIHTEKGRFAYSKYVLTDLAEECRWTAVLVVAAQGEYHNALKRFRLSDLNSDTLEECIVWKKGAPLLCRYITGLPEVFFNIVYGDMPLKGKWPRPKEEVAMERLICRRMWREKEQSRLWKALSYLIGK